MKITRLFLLIAATLLLPSYVSAEKPSVTQRPGTHQINQDKQNVRDDRKDAKQDVQDLKNKIKNKMNHIVNGVITAVNGSTLTVSKDGTNYTVLIDAKTKCVRHFWGKCSVSELSVNDKVNVWGTIVPSTNSTNTTTIQAKLIRDLSIMKRFGAFIGDVTAKSSDSFTIQSKARGTQTIFFISSTKWMNRKEESITFADIQVGHRVRVKGTWDKANNKVMDVKEVKDFSLPAKGSVTPTAGVSPTSAPTATPTSGVSTTPTPTVTITPTATNH